MLENLHSLKILWSIMMISILKHFLKKYLFERESLQAGGGAEGEERDSQADSH